MLNYHHAKLSPHMKQLHENRGCIFQKRHDRLAVWFNFSLEWWKSIYLNELPLLFPMKMLNGKTTLHIHRDSVVQLLVFEDYLVLSTGLIMWIGHSKEIYGNQLTLSTQLINPNYLVILHRRTTVVSLESYPFIHRLLFGQFWSTNRLPIDFFLYRLNSSEQIIVWL